MHVMRRIQVPTKRRVTKKNVFHSQHRSEYDIAFEREFHMKNIRMVMLKMSLHSWVPRVPN